MTPLWAGLRRASALASRSRRERSPEDLRRLKLAGAGFTSILVAGATVMIVLVSVIPKPAVVTVVVAAQVLGSVSEVFGDNGGDLTGEELSRAADGAGVECDGAPAGQAVNTTAATTADDGTLDTNRGTSAGVKPMVLGAQGSIGQEDTETLLDPLPREVSSLRAHVWFLYRLSGMGDWDQFTATYTAAGFSDSEETDNAPLRQVQRLNAIGADVGRYRLTAAALVSAGQQTGWFTDPYPGYRDLVAVELIGSCDSASAEDRMALPLPAATPSEIQAASGRPQ